MIMSTLTCVLSKFHVPALILVVLDCLNQVNLKIFEIVLKNFTRTVLKLCFCFDVDSCSCEKGIRYRYLAVSSRLSSIHLRIVNCYK